MNTRKIFMVGLAIILLASIASIITADAAEDTPDKIKNDFNSKLITHANEQIVLIVNQFRVDIQRAISFERMIALAQSAEKAIFSVIDALEEIIGPIQFNPFYITVCNRKVADCVAFDPPNLIG